jgi:hypothetical protein
VSFVMSFVVVIAIFTVLIGLGFGRALLYVLLATGGIGGVLYGAVLIKAHQEHEQYLASLPPPPPKLISPNYIPNSPPGCLPPLPIGYTPDHPYTFCQIAPGTYETYKNEQGDWVTRENSN